MWDGKSSDKARMLRFYIKEEKNRLENAPLGPRQKIAVKKEIERMQAELKVILTERKSKK